MEPMLAYFDPGAGSIVLQALVGGAAGLWVGVRYWFSGSKAASASERDGRNVHKQANRPSATPSD